MSTRGTGSLLWDCTAWSIGLAVGAWLRYADGAGPVDARSLATVLGVAVAVHVLGARVLFLYRGRYSPGSADEAVAVSTVTLVAGLVAFAAVLLPSPPSVPRSIPLIATLVALVLAVGGRLAVRRRRERRLSRLLDPEAEPAATRSERRVGPGTAIGRDPDFADLLGRGPVDVDVDAVAGYLAGRRVLVTGAGGSIGSELCRQIHRYGPAELVMLDHDESALHATRLAVHGTALLDSPDVVLADIRDADVLTALFVDRRPEVVFHAAALKHLPMLERFPEEAWRTNVVGTQNVLDAARRGGATRFVNISTDKAANPTSVLGRSKRIGERLVAGTAGTYLSVRFGNVLGSRGSVLTTFTQQIAAGGPVTVTHPEVTRFLMTIPEAVQLVVHAAAIGGPGEVLVLDMGQPVRIAALARRLMHIAGRQVDIVYTGLREGEKLHEELLGDGEIDRRPIHPAVSQVPVPPLPASVLRAHARRVGAVQAMVDLHALAVPRPRAGSAPAGGPAHPVLLRPSSRTAS